MLQRVVIIGGSTIHSVSVLNIGRWWWRRGCTNASNCADKKTSRSHWHWSQLTAMQLERYQQLQFGPQLLAVASALCDYWWPVDVVLYLIEWQLVVELCLPRLVVGVSVSFPVDSLEPPSSPLHLPALTIVPRWLWTLTDNDWPQWDVLVDELTQNAVVAWEHIIDVVRRISEQVRQRTKSHVWNSQRPAHASYAVPSAHQYLDVAVVHDDKRVVGECQCVNGNRLDCLFCSRDDDI